MAVASSIADSDVAWAVCPSCHRNSDVRRKGRVRSSQRMTLAHWFILRGRSLCVFGSVFFGLFVVGLYGEMWEGRVVGE